MLTFEGAPKKPTNLTLNTRVLEMAREMGMNISQTVDELLAGKGSVTEVDVRVTDLDALQKAGGLQPLLDAAGIQRTDRA